MQKQRHRGLQKLWANCIITHRQESGDNPEQVKLVITGRTRSKRAKETKAAIHTNTKQEVIKRQIRNIINNDRA